MIFASTRAASFASCEVAAKVRHAMEDFGRHVVVRQDDGVALLLQLVDRLDQRRVVRPFHRRYDVLNARVQRRHLGFERLGPGIGGTALAAGCDAVAGFASRSRV